MFVCLIAILVHLGVGKSSVEFLASLLAVKNLQLILIPECLVTYHSHVLLRLLPERL
jgi:hypothetical protein